MRRRNRSGTTNGLQKQGGRQGLGYPFGRVVGDAGQQEASGIALMPIDEISDLLIE